MNFRLDIHINIYKKPKIISIYKIKIKYLQRKFKRTYTL